MYRPIIVLMFFCLSLSAQDRTVDSLKLLLPNAPNDTARCNILAALVSVSSDITEWPKYNDELMKLSESKLNASDLSKKEKDFYLFHFASALSSSGVLANARGDVPKALAFFAKSLKIREETGDKEGLANSLNNIGAVYRSKGDIQKALGCYSKSLKIREELADKRGTAKVLNNIGFVYLTQNDLLKALEYYERSLKIREEIGDQNGIGISLNNIGGVYQTKGDLTKALEYYERSLKVREKIGDRDGMGNCLNNIGLNYHRLGDLTKALEYYLKGLRIQEEIQDKKNMTTSLNNIGAIYLKQGKHAKAIEFGSRALSISRELGFPEIIKNSTFFLTHVYKASGNYKAALENYELCIKMRDSVNNESTRKASIKNQLKYEYEKQAAADSVAHAKESEIKNAELKRQTAEIKAKKNQQYALFGGLALVMVFAGFMYNRFKITQKQKGIIEHQKEIVEEQKKLVEEKQLEILDSIRYAKRIQLAQIPTEKRVFDMLKKLKRN